MPGSYPLGRFLRGGAPRGTGSSPRTSPCGVLRSCGPAAREAAHAVPVARRRPVRRGADVDEGLRERVLALVPPSSADRDARRAAVGAPDGALPAERPRAEPPLVHGTADEARGRGRRA